MPLPVATGVAEWTNATCQKADVVATSLTNDDGEEARRWSNFVIQVGAEVAIPDAPKTAELGPSAAKLRSEGYSWEEVEVNSAELGDATSWYRRIVLAVKGGGEPTSLGQECIEPMSIRACVGKLRQEAVRLNNEEGELIIDPRIPKRGGPGGARPCGHWHPKDGGTKEIVYSSEGPAPSIRSAAVTGKHGDRVLIMDTREQLPGVWQVGLEETWKLMGGTPAALRRAMSDGTQEQTLAAWAIRSATPHFAEAMIGGICSARAL